MTTILTAPVLDRPEPSDDQPSDGRKRYRWRFVNGFEQDIHDFNLITNLTSGVDPDIVKVHITSPNGKRTYYPPPVYDDDTGRVRKDANGDPILDWEAFIPGTTTWIWITDAIKPGKEFVLTIETDGPFESDEGIRIEPTNWDGNVLDLSVPVIKTWSWGEFWAWVLGGAVGAGVGGGLLNWWTVVALLPCIVFGAIGGAIGGALGVWLTYLFDAPTIWWHPRADFLFGFWFTLAFSILFGTAGIEIEFASAASGRSAAEITSSLGFVAALLAMVLPGILNNLRTSRARFASYKNQNAPNYVRRRPPPPM